MGCLTIETATRLLRRGNSKLGKGIWTFSLPAETTCPGATDACRALCYAKKGRFRVFSRQDAYRANEDVARDKRFVARMTGEVRDAIARVVRIHVSGDFFSAEYVRKWIAIIRATPDTTYYAYTRSWRDPEILPALRRLAALPNMRLWLSADRDAPQPPRVAHTGVAYLIADSDEAVPAGVADLVFIDDARRPTRKVAGAPVCPVENGVEYRNATPTCIRCGLCWRRKRTAADRRRKVQALARP